MRKMKNFPAYRTLFSSQLSYKKVGSTLSQRISNFSRLLTRAELRSASEWWIEAFFHSVWKNLIVNTVSIICHFHSHAEKGIHEDAKRIRQESKVKELGFNGWLREVEKWIFYFVFNFSLYGESSWRKALWSFSADPEITEKCFSLSLRTPISITNQLWINLNFIHNIYVRWDWFLITRYIFSKFEFAFFSRLLPGLSSMFNDIFPI